MDAVWTDESRSAVTVTTTPTALFSSYSKPGNLVFTVNLSEQTVVSKEGYIPKMSPSAPECTITDEQAVETARAAARLLTEAEEYYRSGLAESRQS